MDLRTYRPAFGLVALLLLPAIAQAQNPPPGGNNGQAPASGSGDIGEKQVTLDVDNRHLVDVLPDLMKQVGADYSIDADVKDVIVSLHVSKTKFQATLDTLLKVASRPVTYKLEDGLYHFMHRVDTPGTPSTGPSPTPSGPGHAGPRYRDDPIGVALSELVQYLGGTDLNFADPRAHQGRSLQAGNSSFSGSRNFSQYGFVNGHFSSASYSDPNTGNPNSSTHTAGGGFNFGPLSVSTITTTRSP